MKTKKYNKTPRIRLWIAAFAAILVCFACPFISLADDELPYADIIGDINTANDMIIIEGQPYYLTENNDSTNTIVTDKLVAADLALLEWDAVGNITDNDKTQDKIVGVFNHTIVQGYWNVYEEIYARLLMFVNSSYQSTNNHTHTVETGKTLIYRYYNSANDNTADISITFGGARTVKGTFILLADREAVLNVLSKETLGQFRVEEGGTLIIQGRSPQQKITLKGKDSSSRDSLMLLKKGSIYLSNCEITGYNFGGNHAIELPSGNTARYLYMSNSELSYVKGTEAGGIFCSAYGGNNTETEKSRLYINNSDFTYCSTSGGNTVGGSAIRSYAADRCQLQAVNCDFEYNTCTATGTSSGGGAVYWKSAEGKATFIDCRFKYNEAKKVGGAIYNTGEMDIRKCTFEHNKASDGAAIAVEPPYTSSKYTMNYQGLNGSMTLDGETSIKNNTATNRGGGLYFNAFASQIGSPENSGTQIMTFTMELNIQGATIENNTADYGGGVAMWLDFEERNYTTGITITADPDTGKESSIKNNTANISGGAVWMGSASGCWCKNEANVVSGVTMASGTLEGNKANTQNGGAIFIDVGDPTATMNFNLQGGTVKSNWAQNNGGVAYIKGGNFTMSGGSMEDCYTVTQNGGAIYMSSGQFTMTAGEIKNCRTEDTGSGNGGAVYMAAGTFEMTGGEITNCHALTGSGGAVYLGGGAFGLNGGNITNCTAVNGNGGGIYLGGGDLTVAAGRLSGNKAINGGGAYVNAATAEDGVFVSGGTIYNNTATRNGGGVAVNNGTYKMIGGTVDDNTAALAGGGIYVAVNGVEALVDIRSGVVSNNDAGTSGGALAVVGPEGGEETITVTIGINEVHSCNHNYEGGENIADCPEITGNFATESGGGVYITGGKETHLNTYCMTEENNLAETKPLADNKSKSNFMMVEGGTVIVSTADAENKGDDHGKIVINNTIHVYAGDMELHGSVSNPLILGNIIVDVTKERGSFTDNRTGVTDPDATQYFRIQYCENFLDKSTGKVTGQYTVINVKAGTEHTILPALYEHDGYMIDGWWTSEHTDSDSNADQYAVNSKHVIDADLKLWAKWLLIGYYVYFESGTDGDYRGSMETVRYEYDKEETLPANQFFITGKQFIGWDKDGDGVSDLNDRQEVSKLTTGREITLTAMWVECDHAEQYLTVSQSGANSLVRTCVCEACTQTATLTAEDSVYDGTPKTGATVRITGGSTNGKNAPDWPLEIAHSAVKYLKEGETGTPGAVANLLTDAGQYTATVTTTKSSTDNTEVTAVVQFEIKKANRPNPAKPTYTSVQSEDPVGMDKIVINAVDDPLSNYLYYKMIWHDDEGREKVEQANYNTATSTGMPLIINYTNYYVYAMYDGDDNHHPSEWVRADAVLFYEGNIYIYITSEQGIDYKPVPLVESRGLDLVVTAQNQYYLYNTKVTQTDTTEVVLGGLDSYTLNTSTGSLTYHITNIPESSSTEVNLALSITGVKKMVVITSTVDEGEVFTQVKSDSATITRDSAYTAYFEIENYDVYTEPMLTFSSTIKANTTVILVDKTVTGAPKYFAYTAKSDVLSIPLYGNGGFVQMGTSDEYFTVTATPAVVLKYQVIVDFSDSAGMAENNLTTTFMATAPANVPAFPENGKPVTLEDVTPPSIEIANGNSTIQKTVTVTVPVGSAASSKWLGRSYALILTYGTATAELPADAYIEAVDEQNNVSPTYRNTEGEYIIPVTGGKVTLTLRSDMFGAGEKSYPFTVKLVTVQSGAAKSSANGDELASVSVRFTKAEDIAEPAVSVNTNGKTSYKSGETVCAVVKAENQPADTILVLRLLSRGLPGTEAGEKYTDTGWKVSIGEKTNGDQTTTGGTVSSGVTELETGGYKVEVPLGDTPEGTGSLVLELRDAAGDVITSAECYFTIVGR